MTGERSVMVSRCPNETTAGTNDTLTVSSVVSSLIFSSICTENVSEGGTSSSSVAVTMKPDGGDAGDATGSCSSKDSGHDEKGVVNGVTIRSPSSTANPRRTSTGIRGLLVTCLEFTSYMPRSWTDTHTFSEQNSRSRQIARSCSSYVIEGVS